MVIVSGVYAKILFDMMYIELCDTRRVKITSKYIHWFPNNDLGIIAKVKPW